MKRINLLSVLVAISMVAATVIIVVSIRRSSTEESSGPIDNSSESETTLVRLSAGKLSVAAIKTHATRRQSLVVTRTMPARFGYDELSHVAVRSPTDGVLQSVNVHPGESVLKGTLLATLRSPSVGSARSLLLQRISEADLAAIESDWQATVQNGVEQLTQAIRERKSIEEIKKQLSSSVLGKFRSELLGNYNALLLAEKLSGSVNEIRNSGAISIKVASEREAQQQEAIASLEASLEQAAFETSRKRIETAAKSRVARRSVVLARQILFNLTGQPVDADFGMQEDDDEIELAMLEIRSPIDGTVQTREFVATERVKTGAEMFVIADTSQLWVRADLRGRDLASVTVNVGDPIDVTVSSQLDLVLEGTVHHLGREIDPLSGTVPLVVVIKNQKELFRPGLFARVDVPVGQIDQAIVIPESAVIDLDGQSSAFVQQDGGYRPTPVTLGERSGNMVEVKSGIEEGDKVVTAGTFTLKSELLLEGEE